MKPILIRECARCGAMDRDYFPNQPLCDRCREVDRETEQAAFRAMEAKFGRHIAAQITILSVLGSISPETFAAMFGKTLLDTFQKAVSQVAEPINADTISPPGNIG